MLVYQTRGPPRDVHAGPQRLPADCRGRRPARRACRSSSRFMLVRGSRRRWRTDDRRRADGWIVPAPSPDSWASPRSPVRIQPADARHRCCSSCCWRSCSTGHRVVRRSCASRLTSTASSPTCTRPSSRRRCGCFRRSTRRGGAADVGASPPDAEEPRKCRPTPSAGRRTPAERASPVAAPVEPRLARALRHGEFLGNASRDRAGRRQAAGRGRRREPLGGALHHEPSDHGRPNRAASEPALAPGHGFSAAERLRRARVARADRGGAAHRRRRRRPAGQLSRRRARIQGRRHPGLARIAGQRAGRPRSASASAWSRRWRPVSTCCSKQSARRTDRPISCSAFAACSACSRSLLPHDIPRHRAFETATSCRPNVGRGGSPDGRREIPVTSVPAPDEGPFPRIEIIPRTDRDPDIRAVRLTAVDDGRL